MFMYLGELVEAGPTKTLFTNPKDARTEVISHWQIRLIKILISYIC